jgi:hypothetical protein
VSNRDESWWLNYKPGTQKIEEGKRLRVLHKYRTAWVIYEDIFPYKLPRANLETLQKKAKEWFLAALASEYPQAFEPLNKLSKRDLSRYERSDRAYEVAKKWLLGIKLPPGYLERVSEVIEIYIENNDLSDLGSLCAEQIQKVRHTVPYNFDDFPPPPKLEPWKPWMSWGEYNEYVKNEMKTYKKRVETFWAERELIELDKHEFERHLRWAAWKFMEKLTDKEILERDLKRYPQEKQIELKSVSAALNGKGNPNALSKLLGIHF